MPLRREAVVSVDYKRPGRSGSYAAPCLSGRGWRSLSCKSPERARSIEEAKASGLKYWPRSRVLTRIQEPTGGGWHLPRGKGSGALAGVFIPGIPRDEDLFKDAIGHSICSELDDRQYDFPAWPTR
jgi:hypothetical protein